MKTTLEEIKTTINSNQTLIEEKIDNYLPSAYKFIDENEQEWKLNYNADLEVTNHVLRVKIQDATIKNYLDDLLLLCKSQNQDGGWGNTRDDNESKVRSTSFCVQMLVRANRILKNNSIEKTITKGLDYIISQQLSDGSWKDPTWHYLDAASTSVGTLLFVMNETFVKNVYKESLQKGMSFIVSQRQPNGLWYYKQSGSPVTITAHLLQKCATYYGGSDLNDQTVKELIKLQHEEGHWDNENTDHTCDAIRSMMLTSSRSDNPNLVSEVHLSAYKAVQWLCQVSDEIGGGLGDRPQKLAHVERTCDGIDAMLKFVQFSRDNKEMIKFWH